jgi:SpoVK/Ycf46/Vps4 family AAA+-type ATPase
MTSLNLANTWLEGTYDGLAPQLSGLNNDNFKFHDIKLFADAFTENANLFKDYRTVFDKSELTYVCVQASFANKMFNQQSFFTKKNWYANIKLRCAKYANGNWIDVCSLDMSREITTSDNIIELRNGWGKPEKGAFWEAGEYYWDVWINDKLLVLQYFYINDIGSSLYENGKPYFKDIILQFYDPLKKEDGKFYTVFNKKDTADIGFNTLFYPLQTRPFYCEFFFKGTFNKEPILNCRTGAFYFDNIGTHGPECFQYWVNAGRFTTPDNWQAGLYTFTVSFLNAVIWSATIEISNLGFSEGEFSSAASRAVAENAGQRNYNKKPAPLQDNHAGNDKKEEDYLLELEQMIGMPEIKKSIHDHIKYLKFLQLRKQKGFDDNTPVILHSVFTGNPGTGKTTIIRMLGKIYKSIGLLSRGHVKEADRADLVGEFIGQTAPKVKQAIEDARGGILFIDEAYSLARKGLSANDFGLEVIEILLKEMTSTTGDLAIMCAGYPKEMQEFLESNPGLKSRFAHYYHFEDYTPTELLSIGDFSANKNSVVLPEKTKAILLDQLTKAYRDRDRNFGNARFVNTIIAEAKVNMAKRLMNLPDLDKLTSAQLSTVEPDDVEKIFTVKEKKLFQLGIDEKLLQQSLDELNALTGMANVKQEINELVKLIRFYIETNRNFLGKFSLHHVFTGNPGTGKTTVARIVAKIYKALGLLERGHLVEVDRETLIAGYIGQTAIKTGEKITEAMGGILFIDEAYALVQQQQGFTDFGNEAIQVILKRMEDFRGQFGVIAAGYTENMQQFIQSNPGLQSRFDKTLHFNDYNPGELYEIALSILAKESLHIAEDAAAHLEQYLQHIYETRDQHFGNARKVRQIMEATIRKQNLRMASLPASLRNKEAMATIIVVDILQF